MSDSRTQTGTSRQSNGIGGLLLPCLITFILGFLAGVGFTVYKSSPEAVSATAPAGAEQAKHTAMHQAILNLEAAVTANPADVDSWVRLGHLYYDDNQPEKAIAAYSKSLELHPGDANLLTDLGVMYRRTDRPEKAIELFDQAMAMEPDHQPSRFNKGVVLLYDLNQPEKALAIWEDLLRLNPQATTPGGEPLSAVVNKVKQEQSGKR
jgi:cytochrome c-type biogenesis protein CcmH/NrfG